MQIASHRPGAPLSAFIDQFWYRCGRDAACKGQRALPSGGPDLVINLDDDPFRVFASAEDCNGTQLQRAVVHGAQSRYFVLDARRDVHVIGVHFRPGGGVLLGLPADELTNRHVQLDDLWGDRARLLRERLLDAASPQVKFAVLEQEFLSRLRPAPLVNPAISFALRHIRGSSADQGIASVQAATGYGSRRFTALFTQTVGLTPKLYGRVRRLRGVVERIARGGEIDWADLASEYGYYDQSHLTRDFREFSGVTPGAYRPTSPHGLHMEL